MEVLFPFKAILAFTYSCEKRYSRTEYCEWLLEELSSNKSKDKALIVMGDFNIDLLIENSHSTELRDVMKEFNRELSSPLEVTREFKISKSCLDHIHSDISVLQKEVIKCTISDYYFVWTEFNKNLTFAKESRIYRSFYNLSKGSILVQYRLNLEHSLGCTG